MCHEGLLKAKGNRKGTRVILKKIGILINTLPGPRIVLVV